MVWWYVAVFIVALVVAMSAVSKAQTNVSVENVEATTAQAGRPIPVLFGTKLIKSANIVWYGDVSTRAVKKSGGKK